MELSICIMEDAHHTTLLAEWTCSSRPNTWICWEIDWYVGQFIVLGNSRDWVSMLLHAWRPCSFHRASSCVLQLCLYICRCQYNTCTCTHVYMEILLDKSFAKPSYLCIAKIIFNGKKWPYPSFIVIDRVFTNESTRWNCKIFPGRIIQYAWHCNFKGLLNYIRSC